MTRIGFSMYITLILLVKDILVLAKTSSGPILWGHKHQKCYTVIGNISSGESYTKCFDAEYMKYINESLSSIQQSDDNNPATAYKKAVLTNILHMYDNLDATISSNTFTFESFNPKYDKNMTIYIYPVGYSIPSTVVVEKRPQKSKTFSTVIPGNFSTYISKESAYIEELAESLFVVTYKKAGWDCLRHYEILSSGSIPLFLDIEDCPTGALTWHPKDLYRLLIHQPGLQFYVNLTAAPIGGGRLRVIDNLTLDLSSGPFDQQLYTVITEAMTHYTKNVLSTHSMAAYILRCMQENSEGYIKTPSPKVLYLTHKWRDLYSHDDMGDFQIDLTLIGLKQLLGEVGVIDYPKRTPIYRTANEFNSSGYNATRNRLYGKGFIYGLFFSETADLQSERNPTVVESNIINHVYDVVIVGSGHVNRYKHGLHYRDLPFYDLVCKHYHPNEVAIQDGYDWPTTNFLIMSYNQCASHVFSREGWDNKTATHLEGSVVMCFQAKKAVSHKSSRHENICLSGDERTVYLIENSFRRPFHNGNAFISRGYEWENIKMVHQEEFLSFPLGPPLY